MKRRDFLVLAAIPPLASCSTFRALGQVDQIGPVREALLEYLPEFYIKAIQKDLQFLDGTYEEVQRILKRDKDISLTDLVVLALGAPAAFNMIGQAYGNIRATVLKYHSDSNKPIPTILTTFHASVTPAYDELKTAVNANDKVKRGVELAALLRPLVILL